MPTTQTADRLLDTAQEMIQDRGYNAFSYSDLTKSIEIRTASIHYHFPTKADLGAAVMKRYTARLRSKLDEIETRARSNKGRLKRFIDLYRSTEQSGAMCVCGSLASDHGTLHEDVRSALDEYLDLSHQWIQQAISRGVEAGEFPYSGRPADAAKTLLASLQGGLILARTGRGRLAIDPIQRVFFQVLETG